MLWQSSGFVPTTELMRSASGSAKFYCRYILHGMLRFTKATRSVQQAANAVVSLALDEKFKGWCLFNVMVFIAVCWPSAVALISLFNGLFSKCEMVERVPLPGQ